MRPTLNQRAADRWDAWPPPNLRHCDGPARTYTGRDDPEFVPRPVGFVVERARQARCEVTGIPVSGCRCVVHDEERT